MTRLNKVLIQGRAGGEPDISVVEGGNRRAKLRLALDTGYKDANGEWRDRVDWIGVVTFQERLIEKLETARRVKGRMVFVDGRLRSYGYEKDGEKRNWIEVEAGPYGGIELLEG